MTGIGRPNAVCNSLRYSARTMAVLVQRRRWTGTVLFPVHCFLMPEPSSFEGECHVRSRLRSISSEADGDDKTQAYRAISTA